MCLQIGDIALFSITHVHLMASKQYSHFNRASAVGCMIDSSKSAQREVIQFLCAEEEHAFQILCMIQVVHGEQCLAWWTIFRWCQCYEIRCINIKDLPHPGQVHVLINNATISLQLMLKCIEKHWSSSNKPSRTSIEASSLKG